MALALARVLDPALRGRGPARHRAARRGGAPRRTSPYVPRGGAGAGRRDGSVGNNLEPDRDTRGPVDLVVLAEVRWGYFRTRKQFLLSRFPERWRIFYAQPPAAGADDPWRPRREGRVTYFTVPFLKTATTSAPYNTLASTTAGRALIEWGAERWLSSRLRSLGV